MGGAYQVSRHLVIITNGIIMRCTITQQIITVGIFSALRRSDRKELRR
jgi:hypothetical protein